MKNFFDPHPGLLGCGTPLPETVRIVAAGLDGESMPLETAVSIIKLACPQGEVRVVEEHAMILLEVEAGGGYVHCWRVIRFREADLQPAAL